MSSKSKEVHGTPLWVSGDLNGFFGLFSNSLTNFLTAIALLAVAISMPSDIVYGKIVPATALAIYFTNPRPNPRLVKIFSSNASSAMAEAICSAVVSACPRFNEELDDS